MKTWQKIFSVVLAVCVTVLAACSVREQKACCLCDSFRYHAPRLIDLETGEMIELDLYFPHETKVAELAEDQPEMHTFSFVELGNVTGTKDTGSKTVVLDVPEADKTKDPALCKACKALLRSGYKGRYVLADLYGVESKALFMIEDGTETVLRCYKITMRRDAETGGIRVTVQGIPEP